MNLPLVHYCDQQIWFPNHEDEQDALELGWRATNALIADNDKDPSIGFPTLLTIQYYLDEEAYLAGEDWNS